MLEVLALFVVVLLVLETLEADAALLAEDDADDGEGVVVGLKGTKSIEAEFMQYR